MVARQPHKLKVAGSNPAPATNLINKLTNKGMKKLIIAIAAMLIGLTTMTSCKDTVGGILYNVKVDGNASGDVVVTFPNGSLELDGKAGLVFAYSNDTTLVTRRAEDDLLLGDAIESQDKDIRTFATSVNEGFSVALKDTKAGGEYHVHITGYAKEPNTGIVIAIDKSFDYPAPVDAE